MPISYYERQALEYLADPSAWDGEQFLRSVRDAARPNNAKDASWVAALERIVLEGQVNIPSAWTFAGSELTKIRDGVLRRLSTETFERSSSDLHTLTKDIVTIQNSPRALAHLRLQVVDREKSAREETYIDAIADALCFNRCKVLDGSMTNGGYMYPTRVRPKLNEIVPGLTEWAVNRTARGTYVMETKAGCLERVKRERTAPKPKPAPLPVPEASALDDLSDVEVSSPPEPGSTMVMGSSGMKWKSPPKHRAGFIDGLILGAGVMALVWSVMA